MTNTRVMGLLFVASCLVALPKTSFAKSNEPGTDACVQAEVSNGLSQDEAKKACKHYVFVSHATPATGVANHLLGYDYVLDYQGKVVAKLQALGFGIHDECNVKYKFQAYTIEEPCQAVADDLNKCDNSLLILQNVEYQAPLPVNAPSAQSNGVQ